MHEPLQSSRLTPVGEGPSSWYNQQLRTGPLSLFFYLRNEALIFLFLFWLLSISMFKTLTCMFQILIFSYFPNYQTFTCYLLPKVR